MANPQPDQFTKISNELLEAFAKTRISGEEMQLLWVILRQTYGFRKKNDEISLSQFCLRTGLKKPHICRALSKLVTKNIVIKNDNGFVPTYGIQKDYSRWEPLPKKVTLSKKVKSVTKKDKKPLSKMVPTKEIYTKEKKESSPEPKKTAPAGIGFSFEDRRFTGIQDRDKNEWRETYPAVDVDLEILKAKEWLLANPEKRKKNYRRFLVNWFNRTQERGGTRHGDGADKRTFDPVEKRLRDSEKRLRGGGDKGAD